MNSGTASETQSPVNRNRILPKLAGSFLGLGGLVLAGSALWTQLQQSVEDLVQASASTPVTASVALPADAPSVSVTRANAQESDSRKASTAVAAVQLSDWEYTQYNYYTPFNFLGGAGLDFFNPLFAFDYGGSLASTSPYNPLLSSLFGFPFGGGGGNSGSPIIIINGTGSSTGTGTPTTTTTTSNGTTTTNVTVPFLNGSNLALSITIITTGGGGGSGSGGNGIFNRHFGGGFGSGGGLIIIIITFTPVSPVK